MWRLVAHGCTAAVRHRYRMATVQRGGTWRPKVHYRTTAVQYRARFVKKKREGHFCKYTMKTS